jgi:hypothetical protein
MVDWMVDETAEQARATNTTGTQKKGISKKPLLLLLRFIAAPRRSSLRFPLRASGRRPRSGGWAINQEKVNAPNFFDIEVHELLSKRGLLAKPFHRNIQSLHESAACQTATPCVFHNWPIAQDIDRHHTKRHRNPGKQMRNKPLLPFLISASAVI